VKRSGRDEPIRVVIYMCMEAMLGISLYIYFYLKLAKMLCLSYYCLYFSSTKLEKRAEQVLPGSEGGEKGDEGDGDQGGWRAQTMYAHMNK
jgi:hypothetical protein